MVRDEYTLYVKVSCLIYYIDVTCKIYACVCLQIFLKTLSFNKYILLLDIIIPTVKLYTPKFRRTHTNLDCECKENINYTDKKYDFVCLKRGVCYRVMPVSVLTLACLHAEQMTNCLWQLLSLAH